MTAHELLENAAKYASDGHARLQLNVTPRGEDAIVRVSVTNNSTAEHISQLGGCYAEMNAATDAMAHYFTLMRRNAKSGASSRLGLARVRAEGEMEIEVDIQGDVVKVVASGVVMRWKRRLLRGKRHYPTYPVPSVSDGERRLECACQIRSPTDNRKRTFPHPRQRRSFECGPGRSLAPRSPVWAFV